MLLSSSQGATHEHMRWDRDTSVKILRENLEPGSEANFDAKSTDAYSTFGTPFDFDSIMHHAVLNLTTPPGSLYAVAEGFRERQY